MYVQDAELLKGLSRGALDEISHIMVEHSYDKGAVLFTESDPAENFFILKEGRVRISIGKEGEIDYTVNKPGEAFGWSGLLDRSHYTAGAECLISGRIIKIKRDDLIKVFERNPEAGLLFFKGLAGAIFQRLILNYNAFLAEGSLKGVTSAGTDDLGEPGED
jgi:CRP-like cAMP-binding protein